MKKNIVLMAVVILLLSISTTDYSMAATSPSYKTVLDKYGYGKFSYGMTATRNLNMKIYLNNEGTAKFSYGGETFDIKYMRYNNHILIGNGQDQDLLKILNLATNLSGKKYDLILRNPSYAGSIDETPRYRVIIVEYEGKDGDYGLDYLFTSDKFKISNLLEFENGGGRTNGYPYMFDDSTDGMPHTLLINGQYQYYLPLRYIFEQLGFTVEYENNTVTIS
ncbi:hypothetical protein [Aminipila sp.]|uniref:hypothetical protein n=1 Tax=Aminipila sp. TaxID=2060095 RepID=UPI0028A0C03D|nr:hypothetical protein [Aminipila sp.]